MPHFLLVAAALCLATSAARAEPPSVRIPRVTRPPKLEDFLAGRAREAEARLTDLRQQQPGDGIPASQETTAYLSYDDDHLYAVFVCKSDPGSIRARMVKREAISGDDVVGVLLDTFHDRQRAYMFIANPLGIQLDGITTEGQDDDFSFDTLWRSEGRLTADGFIVWMAIPFKSLRFPNASAQTWGVAVARIFPRTNEQSFWPYISRRVAGFAQQLATLEGIERISPGRNVQLIPYGALTSARFLDRQVPQFRTERVGRGGLDAKLVVRDALTLDVAVNPDFSQVESDEPQVTVNQRFEVFFPEKRPFFIENAAFFETRQNLFFSRRIADPQFGARVTGKIGRWALGGLAIDDRAPGRRVRETDPLHGRRAGIGVLRAQREFGQQSSVGLLVTSRDFGPSANRVFAFDTRLKLNSNWIASGQIAASRTRRLDGTRLSGAGSVLQVRRSGRQFNYSGRYLDLGPDFRSQLGFIPRVDVRQIEQYAEYLWRPARSRLLNAGPSAFGLVNWDRRGRVQDWAAHSEFGLDFAGPTEVEASRSEAFELFQGLGFRTHSTRVFVFSDWLKWLGIRGSYRQGTSVNFFPAPGLAPFLANSAGGTVGLTLRPASQVRFDQTYLYTRLETRAGTDTPGTTIFTNHILRSRLSYQLTRELSLRAILDYHAVLPNPALVDLSRAKRLTGDVLVTYLVNPGTALHIGYTDGYENVALDAGTPPTLRRINRPTTSTGRQFFVKTSYLVRF